MAQKRRNSHRRQPGRSPWFWGLLVAIALPIWAGLVSHVAPVSAEVACPSLPKWSSTTPAINQHHIFCGEWNDRSQHLTGFHAQPGGQTPSTVAAVNVTQSPNSAGVYGVEWRSSQHGGQTKFSTMFPDRCSQNQILASIAYASQHQGRCTGSAPSWAWCGPSSPPSGAETYCVGNNGAAFSIAGAFLNDGRINTAFPLR